MKRLLSIIIPCYNEQDVVNTTYQRLCNAVGGLKDVDSEIIFVDDGSTDDTLRCLQAIGDADERVVVLAFSRNFGHQNAVTAGINNCRGDMALIMDADLQDPPELIGDIIRTMDEAEAQVVYCVRRERDGETFFKKATAKIFYRFINYLSEVRLPVDAGDFRLIGRDVIDEFNRLGERNKYVRGLTTWVGFKQVPFYYHREARVAGKTKYNLSRMVRLSLTSVMYFSTKPLKIATFLGFFFVMISFVLFLWSFFGKIFGYTHADSGWTSLFVLIVFFGGIQLITLGIIGTYIGNIFDEVKRRPEYVLKKRRKDLN